MAEFRMPSLGADMDAGTLVAWHLAVGDHVTRGDIVAEVDTDKSVIDVETFATGTVEAILVSEGQRVPVGTPLAIIREDAEVPQKGVAAPHEGAAAPREGAPPPREVVSVVRDAAGAPVPGPDVRAGRHPVSPLARRHARSLGVDLADVTGTGPDGAVTTADVERFAAARATAERGTAERGTAERGGAEPVAAEQVAPAHVPLSGAERQSALRRAVAASMARSKREIPHYYLATDVDASRAVRWLDDRNRVLPVTERVLPAALLLKATALALRETPDLNGFWEDGAFRAAEHVHLGVAVALRGGGLVAPAIHDADLLPLGDLMARLRDLVGRARAGGLRSSEMSDPTITVTSLGDQGVDLVMPVIYPPQVAIVGIGRIRERPWAVDGMLGVRPIVTLTLAADHRVTDGHRGAQFLTALDRLLQDPEAL
jgi:pyruvate/2-oxoglutarate dehydrogenase complex dihydrolipoamide acyltransferase (E2) component